MLLCPVSRLFWIHLPFGWNTYLLSSLLEFINEMDLCSQIISFVLRLVENYMNTLRNSHTSACMGTLFYICKNVVQ